MHTRRTGFTLVTGLGSAHVGAKRRSNNHRNKKKNVKLVDKVIIWSSFLFYFMVTNLSGLSINTITHCNDLDRMEKMTMTATTMTVTSRPLQTPRCIRMWVLFVCFSREPVYQMVEDNDWQFVCFVGFTLVVPRREQNQRWSMEASVKADQSMSVAKMPHLRPLQSWCRKQRRIRMWVLMHVHRSWEVRVTPFGHLFSSW